MLDTLRPSPDTAPDLFFPDDVSDLTMRFFRRKKKRRSESDDRSPTGRAGGPGFYSERSGPEPLAEPSQGFNPRQTHRTSRHSLGRRRERSNRVSNKELLFIVLRALLIVVLLAVGFIGLKIVLERLAEPSEKEQLVWEANELQMGMAFTNAVSALALSVGMPSELYVDTGIIERRLEKWALTEQLLRSADTYMQRNINEEAIGRLKQALASTPHNHKARKMLLLLYMQTGAFAEAIPLCVQLLDQDSQQGDVQLLLLQAMQAENMLEATVALADWMLKDQPDNLDVLRAAAEARLAQGDKEQALVFFARMLEKDRADTSALEGSGQIYWSQGAYKSAVPYYMELVRVNPQIDYYHALALCYAQQNEAGKAIIIIGQAASLFGEANIQPWLMESALDGIRETVEFRAFADRVVGIETRKAIEKIRKREIERAAPAIPGAAEPVARPVLQPLKPTR